MSAGAQAQAALSRCEGSHSLVLGPRTAQSAQHASPSILSGERHSHLRFYILVSNNQLRVTCNRFQTVFWKPDRPGRKNVAGPGKH